MCFDNDGDWGASVYDETCERRDVVEKCCECRREIAAGEWRVVIYMQEFEECQTCEDPEGEGYAWDEEDNPPEPCEDGKHEYGNTWRGRVCVGCAKILAAIYEAEAEEGCPEWSRQPLFGELADVMHEDAVWGDCRYAIKAMTMFPELRSHSLLAMALEPSEYPLCPL